MFRFLRPSTRRLLQWDSTESWKDMLLVESRLSEEEILIRDNVRRFCEDKLKPRVRDAFEHEKVDLNLMREFGKLGILGIFLEGYGCPGASHVSYGLVAKEIERIDSGYRSAFSVQTSLVMFPIWKYGSEKAKEKYLPKLQTGELTGCFGLTEAEAGSDPGSMRTTAKLMKTHYLLNGSKTWISNAQIADVFIIWARSEEGHVQGFILEKSFNGLSTTKIDGKLSLRTSPTGMIFMDNVEVPLENCLDVQGFKAPLSCLSSARLGIAWGALGAAEDCFYKTREYALTRIQFKRPLARHQLIQKKFADILTELTLANNAVFEATRMKERGSIHPNLISLLKRNSCQKSLEIARVCRDIHGGNGITSEYDVFRHMSNLETVNTYEGTSDIHALILGRAVTGIPAFS